MKDNRSLIYFFSYLRHVPSTNGALILLAQHSHSRRTFKADGVIANTNRINFCIFETHYADIITGIWRLDIRHFRNVTKCTSNIIKTESTQPLLPKSGNLTLNSQNVVNCDLVTNLTLPHDRFARCGM